MIGESIEKRACARDLRDCADPENRFSSANAQNLAKLSGRDLPRSADHRLRFASALHPPELEPLSLATADEPSILSPSIGS